MVLGIVQIIDWDLVLWYQWIYWPRAALLELDPNPEVRQISVYILFCGCPHLGPCKCSSLCGFSRRMFRMAWWEVATLPIATLLLSSLSAPAWLELATLPIAAILLSSLSATAWLELATLPIATLLFPGWWLVRNRLLIHLIPLFLHLLAQLGES